MLKFAVPFRSLALVMTLAVAMPALAEQAATPAPVAAPNSTAASNFQIRPDSFADLAEKLLPAVVNISTLQVLNANNAPEADIPQFPPGSPFEQFFKDFMEQQGRGENGRGGNGGSHMRRAAALGSGFIIDAGEGYVVTNNHVIQDAEEITVILQDDTNLPAKLIGRDEKTDLALLKVNPSGHHLTAVPWGNSDVLRVGDWVLAIGNPFGLGGTVTQGIISARARNINSGPYDDFLQTDASINRGNSGGPMFNLKGEVIGINTAIFSPSGGSIGIGFAIPSNLAKGVITQLVEYGRTKRGWLGVRIQAVTPDIAESLNFGTPRGALIAGVTPDGPAAKAGILAGDIVTAFNGKPIEEMRRLPRIVAETPVGEDAQITVWRSGETKNLTVKVAELEQAEDEGLTDSGNKPDSTDEQPLSEDKAYGIALSSLTRNLRAQYEIADSVNGVIITHVDEDSKAAERDLQEGDVIVEASQTEVKTPAEFMAKVEEAKKSGRKSIFLLVDRKGDMRFVALPLEDSKPADDKPDAPNTRNNSHGHD